MSLAPQLIKPQAWGGRARANPVAVAFGGRQWPLVASRPLLSFTYNPANQLLTLKDGKAQATKWNYDVFGRVTNKVDAADTEIFRYRYNADDRLTNRWTLAKGDTFYGYDPIGNLTNVDYPGTIMDIALQYDPLNRLTNVTSAAGPFHYELRAADWVLLPDLVDKLWLAENYTHIVREYDDLARLTQTVLWNPVSVQLYHQYEYNEGHQRTRQTFNIQW